jgi:SPP1 family predicted phage head-tail adaptor
MRDVSCKLISTSFTKNKIGVQTETIVKTDCPIIKVEDIYAKEFYEANEQGYKPSLRLRVSILNYENQRELIYMGKTYTIIRTQEVTADEIILVCERKVKNV